MKISSPFNRFYHSILNDVHKKALALHLTVENMEFLKQGLKKVNENYPRENDKTLSTCNIDNKQLVQHIEFIISYLGEYGITPNFVEEEWERLKKGIENEL